MKPQTPVPLLSWDIFMMGHDLRLQLGKDFEWLYSKSVEEDWDQRTWSVQEELQKGNVVLMTGADQKICFATANLSVMTGYEPEDVIGWSPKLFQGEGTEPERRAEIRSAIESEKPFDVVIRNYRKDGSEYNCHVRGFPVKNREGKLLSFIAFERVA